MQIFIWLYTIPNTTSLSHKMVRQRGIVHVPHMGHAMQGWVRPVCRLSRSCHDITYWRATLAGGKWWNTRKLQRTLARACAESVILLVPRKDDCPYFLPYFLIQSLSRIPLGFSWGPLLSGVQKPNSPPLLCDHLPSSYSSLEDPAFVLHIRSAKSPSFQRLQTPIRSNFKGAGVE